MASANLQIVISAVDRFTGTASRITGSLNNLDRGFGRAGKGAAQLGTGLARAGVVAGTVAAGGLAAVAKAAIDFEDAFAGVKKTVDETDLRRAGLTFEDLARQFRDMATEIPIAATEFARIGETAGALGIAAQDIDDFTKTVALLGVTTNLSTEAAAEALGKVGTILGLTGRDFEAFADTLVHLGNIGASTESEIIEITKRFAAAGRQAGISTDNILALASAMASLGVEPEAAGSALSRIFANMASDIATATDEGKAFAAITGRSLSALTEDIRNGRSLDILHLFLERLSRLDPVEAARALKEVGLVNVRDRDAILKMAQNLEKVDYWLKESTKSAGSLGEEASKRFDTIASKLQLLKNNVIEAAITIGEGFTPAIGRAADKLSAFLKQDSNRAELKRLGEDIGRFIDGINWAKVLDGARSFLDILRETARIVGTIVSALDTLPTEVKAAGLGFLALNKVSGGLVGQGLANIIGGLGGTAIRGVGASIPGIGRAFAQPVFVTNWPPGFGLGGPGGGGGGGTKPGVVLPMIGAGIAIPDLSGDPRTRALIDSITKPNGGATTGGGGAGGGFGSGSRSRGGSFASPAEREADSYLAFLTGRAQEGAEEAQRQVADLSRGMPGAAEALNEAANKLKEAAAAEHDRLREMFEGGGLRAFRTDVTSAIDLFDERIRYLEGGEGSHERTGPDAAFFDSVVTRDIEALKKLLPGASPEEQAKLQTMISVLEQIRDKEVFPTGNPLEQTKTAVEGVKNALTRVPDALGRLKIPEPRVTVNVSTSTNVSVRGMAAKTVVLTRYGRLTAS